MPQIIQYWRKTSLAKVQKKQKLEYPKKIKICASTNDNKEKAKKNKTIVSDPNINIHFEPGHKSNTMKICIKTDWRMIKLLKFHDRSKESKCEKYDC